MIKSPKLIEWLKNVQICKDLEPLKSDYVDYDVCFDSNLDVDYDTQLKGVSMAKFLSNYQKWIQHCQKRLLEDKEAKSTELVGILEDQSINSLLVRLCFAMSLVCRRALNTACTGGAGGAMGAANTGSSGIGETGAGSSNAGASLAVLNSISGSMNLGSNCGVGINGSSHLDTDSLSSFQHGYYTLFKGDVRIQSSKDEWIFNDMEILKQVNKS